MNTDSSRPCSAGRTVRRRDTCLEPTSRVIGAPVTVRRPVAELAYPQIAAARRAACAVIERGNLPGVPVSASEVVPLRGLLAYLVDPQRTPAQLETVWETLIERARRDADWQLVALGMAAPRLAQIAARAAGRLYTNAREEITAAVLDAFAEALLTLTPNPDKGLVFYQLMARAQAGAQKVIDQHKRECRRNAGERETDEVLPLPGSFGSAPNHPDIALARLVAHGVLTKDEADLIGRHRLERVTLRQLGQERGWYPMQASRALRAAECKVAKALGHRAPESARRGASMRPDEVR